jgi:hypothetical protein
MNAMTELEHELVRACHPREAEGEAFFNHLSAMADRSGRSQGLRQVAIEAARSAQRGALAKRPWPAVEGEQEQEGEAELEAALRAALAGGDGFSALAEMEHLGHAAAEAETEQEAAEHFLPLVALAGKALLPLAAKALPKLAMKVAPKLLSKVAPQITRGLGNVARSLFRQPGTRQLLRAVPRIAQRTVGQVLSQAGRGRPVTATGVARTLARQTLRTLGTPRQAVHAYQRSRRIDRRWHHQQAKRVGPPAPGATPVSTASAGPMPSAAVSYGHQPHAHLAPAPSPGFMPWSGGGTTAPFFHPFPFQALPPAPVYAAAPTYVPAPSIPHPAVCAACGR